MSSCRCICISFCPVFNVYTFWLCVCIYLYYVSLNLPLLLSSHLILLIFFATRHMIFPQISHGSRERHQQLRTGETNSHSYPRSHSNPHIFAFILILTSSFSRIHCRILILVLVIVLIYPFTCSFWHHHSPLTFFWSRASYAILKPPRQIKYTSYHII